jgi:hypothetical protein
LAAKFSPEQIGTASISRSGISRQRFLNNNNNKTLPPYVISIINDANFWIQLHELQSLLLPLFGILNKLQKDIARLYEIVHCFGWIVKIFMLHDDDEFSNHMMTKLENRWIQWEQPLLLLSFVLHPKYRISYFNSSATNVSYSYFGQWIIYYYQVWFNKMPKKILREYLLYQREIFPFNLETYNQFDDNIIDFWESAIGLAEELSYFALRLFGICVNSASVERLWSNMGFLHTKHRNRLNVSKKINF